MDIKPKKVAFQGMLGAYSHQACTEAFPTAEVLACSTFEDTITSVKNQKADVAMLPVENSTYGRVADIHSLLPDSGLHIVGEHFVRVHINLMALKGVSLSEIKSAMSHTVLLGQCRKFLNTNAITPVVAADTAGAAQKIATENNREIAALASEMAAQIYDLEILAPHIEDTQHNTTRFLVMSPEEAFPENGSDECITTFVFRVRNIPAALYKALGGFATNTVNMVKLESYMVDGSFTATQFYADIIGHPNDQSVNQALEELGYFTDDLKILGVYKADTFRRAG